MRRRNAFARTIPGLLMAALLAPAAHAQVKDYRQLKFSPLRPFSIPQSQRMVLDNGMVVILMEDHELPLIEVTARIRTGSRLVPGDKTGLSTVFGQVLRTGGTGQMTGDQIDDFLEARAAQIESRVADESASANLSCLVQDFPDVLRVFADILRNPVFDDGKIKLAKNQVTAGIARRNDDPQGIMFREFDKLVYGPESPYARVPEYATLERVTRDDLITFHKNYFTPNRIILGVVGDFSAPEMGDKIKAALGDWPKGPDRKDPEATYQTAAKPGIYSVAKEDMTQSDIIMGHMGIRKDNPDFFAVEVLNVAFGGSFAARLLSNVRTRKGLAYSVSGLVDSNYDYPGTFNAWMTTKTETTAAGIDALLEEIDGVVARPPTAEEVQRSKDSILNSFVFNYDSPEKILRQQITYEYFGFPADYLATYRNNIEKVTPADVARVAKQYIHKDQLAILVVGPSKGQDRPLDSFGKVAKLDITIPEGVSPGAAGAAGPVTASTPAATAESVAKGTALFAKVLDGLGGPVAVGGVKALRSVLNSTRKTPQGEMTLKVVSTFSMPDRIRQELTTPMGSITVIIAGGEGYMVLPSGPQPMPESQRSEATRSIKRQLITLAQHFKDPDFKVQHLGTDTVDGTVVEKLLVNLGGEESRLYVDPATGRILRQVYQGQSQQGPGEFAISFSDFRQVAGITLPFRSQTSFNGETQETRIFEEITVNPAVDAKMFAKPEGAPGSTGGQN